MPFLFYVLASFSSDILSFFGGNGMPTSKFTFTFTQLGYGWSESWYTDNILSLSAAQTLMANYVNLRVQFLALQGFCTFARWSILQPFANQGQKQSFVQGADGGVGPVPGFLNNPSDASFTSFLITCKDVLGQHAKPWYCRGNDDVGTSAGGTLTPSAKWTTAFNNWVPFMKANNMGWWGNNALVHNPVLTVTQLPSGQLTIVMGPTPLGVHAFSPWPVGYRLSIRLFGMQGCFNMNRSLVVTVNGIDTCTTRDRFGILPYLGGGTCSTNGKQTYVVNSYTPARVVERRPGRPSYQSRGRRKGTPTG